MYFLSSQGTGNSTFFSNIPQTESAKSASLSITGQRTILFPLVHYTRFFPLFLLLPPQSTVLLRQHFVPEHLLRKFFCSSLCSDAYLANLSKVPLLFWSQEPISLQLTSTNPSSVSSVAAKSDFFITLEVL